MLRAGRAEALGNTARELPTAGVAGATWFTWWCSHDITRDYCVEELEYSLGLMTVENKRKPQAETFRRIVEHYRRSDPAGYQSIGNVPDPPARPRTSESTWDWIEANRLGSTNTRTGSWSS